jgi:hypothetical protein
MDGHTGAIGREAVSIKQIIVVSFATANLFLSTAKAEPNKVLYELQERCGKKASDTFKNEVGTNITKTSEGGTMISNYENHYNGRLNKCFYLQSATIIPKDRNTSRSLQLFDLHENREVGTYFSFDKGSVMQCQVGNEFCHTEQEWRALVKPFMED